MLPSPLTHVLEGKALVQLLFQACSSAMASTAVFHAMGLTS
jgi:hypothetical protein